MNVISALVWVPQGSAKHIPYKIKASENEISELFAKSSIDNDDTDDEEDTNNATAPGSTDRKRKLKNVKNSKTTEDSDEDSIDEDENLKENGKLSNIVFHKSNKDDPYITDPVLTDEELSDEDMKVNDDDNMVVASKVCGDEFTLEVYLYNNSEGNMYVHHDYILPNFPLCVEWLNFDPGEPNPGNFAAIGCMNPNIELWDLDFVDSLEPAFILAGKEKKTDGKKKKKKQTCKGHTDAVLGLSWNSKNNRVLASASADSTVIVWDLSVGEPVVDFKHDDKVQAIQWHCEEQECLLTGSFDKTVRLYDCRSPNTCNKKWNLPGEIERVSWDEFNPYYFCASSDTGHVYRIDSRLTDPVISTKLHDKAVTGLVMPLKDCIVSCAQDGILKLSGIESDNTIKKLYEKNMQMGPLNCLSCRPEKSSCLAIGGKTETKIVNLEKIANFKKRMIGNDIILENSADDDKIEIAACKESDDDNLEKELKEDLQLRLRSKKSSKQKKHKR